MQPSNTELILIRVTGEDRPGLTASVTEILAKYDATILDIGQADIHNTLSLGILFRSEERHSGFIMKELLFKASSLGVTIRFEPIGTDQYENWVGMQGKNRYILTVLGRKLSARQISAATRVLAEQGLNIDAIKRLTGRIPWMKIKQIPGPVLASSSPYAVLPKTVSLCRNGSCNWQANRKWTFLSNRIICTGVCAV